MAEPAALTLSVAIATRNRPASLVRCISSLALLGDLVSEILVVDDASDVPAAEAIATLPPALASKVTVIRQPPGPGYIAGRNRMMREATSDVVLSMDDDAYLLEAEGVRRAMALMARRPDVAAVACAQAEPDGAPWPPAMQPSTAQYDCYVAAYIGFAHLVRRGLFVDLGGYRESFFFYGEEKDYCLRALDAGHQVVYMPGVRVAHVPDPSGRDDRRYIRYVIRNDCLFSLYNEPMPVALASLPVRLGRFVSMARRGGVWDPGGIFWVVGSLLTLMPSVWRDRKPVSWASFRRWRRLRRISPRLAPEVAA